MLCSAIASVMLARWIDTLKSSRYKKNSRLVFPMCPPAISIDVRMS